LAPVNSKISHCLQVEEPLVLVETLKYLVLKASALLQVVSVNPSRHLVVAYLVVAWEAANYNLKAVSLDLVLLLELVVSEETLAHNLSLVVKIFPSNLA
jgi:hypothetical protein